MSSLNNFNQHDFSYKNTGIYIYHNKNPHDYDLKNIIEKVINDNPISLTSMNFLDKCYEKIIENNLRNVLCDMIDSNYRDDKIVICITAIDKNCLDIIDLLADKNFDFNQLVLSNNFLNVVTLLLPDSNSNYDILTFAVRRQKLTMIKKLISYGANPLANNQMALLETCKMNYDIIDCFLELDIPHNFLCQMFLKCCSENFIYGINKLLSLGVTINEVTTEINNSIGKYSVDVVKILVDNNYLINTNMPLHMACINSNDKLVDFFLDFGLKPNVNTIEHVFDKMDMKIINLFTKYCICLSALKPCIDYEKLTNDLLNNDIKPLVLITYLFKKLETYSNTNKNTNIFGNIFNLVEKNLNL